MFVILFAGLFSFISCEKDVLTIEPEETISEKSGVIHMEGTLESFIFFSAALAGNMLDDPAERKVNVYLPRSYYASPLKRFPVIYFLHGIPVGENSLIKNTEDFQEFNAAKGL